MRKERACDKVSYHNCRFCSDQCLGGIIFMIDYDTTAEDVSIESMMYAWELITDLESLITEQDEKL